MTVGQVQGDPKATWTAAGCGPVPVATMPKFNSPPDISKFMAIGGLCRNSSTSQG
jgi:hypothetical protein